MSWGFSFVLKGRFRQRKYGIDTIFKFPRVNSFLPPTVVLVTNSVSQPNQSTSNLSHRLRQSTLDRRTGTGRWTRITYLVTRYLRVKEEPCVIAKYRVTLMI